MDQFEPLDHGNVTDDQRKQRRDRLIEVFHEGIPLPVLDLYVDERNGNLPFLRASLTTGSWYWIGVRQRDGEDPLLPIFVDETETGATGYQPDSLAFLEAVPPFIEYRLRDVFSLAHVPDTETGETGSETAPPPDEPYPGIDLDRNWSAGPQEAGA
jgi:hypothetical protein